MTYAVRPFNSDKVLASGLSQDEAESFVDDYVTKHGGVLMIEEEPMTTMKDQQDRIMARMAATITTLLETGTGAPESTFYLAFGMELSEWQVCRSLMLSYEYVTVKANYVELTDKGRRAAEKINAALSQSEAK